MKIRYTSDESGCFGETNEVVNIPNELLTDKTQDGINQILKHFISSFGCSQCVDYEKVSEETITTMESYYDDMWGEILISLNPKN